MRFGCRKHENHMLRRFFERFEQSVKSLLAQHMDLIDNVKLVAPSDRGEPDIIPELSHLIDAVITGAVDLKNVKADTERNLPTRIARAAWSRGRAVHAIQCFCQNPGSRCFPGPSRANKQISMRQSTLLNRVLESLHDVILTQNIVKDLRPIFARKNLVTHEVKLEVKGER